MIAVGIIVITTVQICTLYPAASVIIPHRQLRLGEIIYQLFNSIYELD